MTKCTEGWVSHSHSTELNCYRRPSRSVESEPIWWIRFCLNWVLQKSLLIHDSTDEISTGWFFNCSAQISVLKRKMMFNQRGSRISWNRISDWLPIVFHFGTENWEELLKKTTLHQGDQTILTPWLSWDAACHFTWAFMGMKDSYL